MEQGRLDAGSPRARASSIRACAGPWAQVPARALVLLPTVDETARIRARGSGSRAGPPVLVPAVALVCAPAREPPAFRVRLARPLLLQPPARPLAGLLYVPVSVQRVAGRARVRELFFLRATSPNADRFCPGS